MTPISIRNIPVRQGAAGAGLVAVLFAAVSAPAAAQDGARPATEAHGKAAFMATYDRDGDGAVTADEYAAERHAGFRERDADGDGVISRDEYVAEYEARLRAELDAEFEAQMRQARSRFDVLDDDEDAAMTPAEFDDSGAYMFESLDSNGDGVVDGADEAERY